MEIETQHFANLKHVGTLERLNNQANAFIKLVKHPGKLAPVQVLSYCIDWFEFRKQIKVSNNCQRLLFSAAYLDIAVSLNCIFRRLE